MTSARVRHFRKPIQRGFTLIEVLIVIAIVGVLAGIAIPAFTKYLYSAREAEGVQTLMLAWRDEMRVKQRYGRYTELLASSQSTYEAGSEVPVLHVRLSSKPRFNLITGNFDTSYNLVPGRKFSFDQLPEYSTLGLSPRINEFGTMRDPITLRWDKFLIGVEGNLDGDSNLHVLAVDERGTLFKLCDDGNNETSPSAASVYSTYSDGSDIDCGE